MATRFSHIRSSQPTPGERFPSVREKLDELAILSDDHFAEVSAMLKSGEGTLDSRDLLYNSVVNRSLEIIEAFLSAMSTWSISAASALVRVQVDNLLRAHLFAVTPDIDAIYIHITAGKPLGGLKLPPELIELLPENKQNRKDLTHADWVLVAIATHAIEWVGDVYKSGSLWIHHSAAHLNVTHKITADGRFTGRIPSDIDQFDESYLLELCTVMNAATTMISAAVIGWTERKIRRNSEESSTD